MGRPSGQHLLRLLQDFMLVAGPETWLVWTETERQAFASLYNKVAQFVGEQPYESWIADYMADSAEEA